MHVTFPPKLHVQKQLFHSQREKETLDNKITHTPVVLQRKCPSVSTAQCKHRSTAAETRANKKKQCLHPSGSLVCLAPLRAAKTALRVKTALLFCDFCLPSVHVLSLPLPPSALCCLPHSFPFRTEMFSGPNSRPELHKSGERRVQGSGSLLKLARGDSLAQKTKLGQGVHTLLKWLHTPRM